MNRLINEKSPYLLKHAHNPVDWYPWGEEAFEKARNEDKPIFLSIGYSSCHWCSVMERESFNDLTIAKIINRYFVPIKVDREERPDIDEIYMRAVQLMSGQGGWPLNVFLTPDLKPFFGGTYFPPERRFGLPSFKEVLEAVARAWKERRDEIIKSSEQIVDLIKRTFESQPTEERPSLDPMDWVYERLVLSFDHEFGGFGEAPKFPTPPYLLFLLRYYRLKRDRMARLMLEKTLRKMFLGGIYDQVGGGFHRYATDKAWRIPHFEKMLYDNAQLLRVYAEAYKAFNDEFFADAALDIARWILREMRNSSGGFYSSIDSETNGEEGIYYLWSYEEILNVFGRDLGREVASYFGATERGNFEGGRNVLYVAQDIDGVAHKLGMGANEAARYVRECLLSFREKRNRPMIDYKIQPSWNGLAIWALSYAGAVLRRDELLEGARGSADFILDKLFINGELRKYWCDGPSRLRGILEDYSFLGDGLIELWQWTGIDKYLDVAAELAEIMLTKFWSNDGGFYYSSNDSSDTPLNIIDSVDNALPSGNSVAAHFLARLYLLTGEGRYLEAANKTFRRFWSRIGDNPAGYSYLVSGLAFLSGESKQLYVAVPDSSAINEARAIASKPYEPYMVISIFRPGREYARINEVICDKRLINGRVTYYLCRSFSCDMPTNDVEELLAKLNFDKA